MSEHHIDNDEYIEIRMQRKFEAADVRRDLDWMYGSLVDAWSELRELPFKMWIPEITFKFVGLDRRQRAINFAVCSPKADPAMVSRNLEKAEEARRVLGPLGDVILSPLHAGDFDGRSFAIFRYCEPLRSGSPFIGRAQYAWFRRTLARWLRGAARKTAVEPTPDEAADGFAAPLEHLAGSEGMPGFVRDAAAAALRRLDAGLWRPRLQLMHNDLTTGNLLLAPRRLALRRFVVLGRCVLIDWERSMTRGYGFYDLYTMASTLGIGGNRLASEIRAHCEILDCDRRDVSSYLLAATGRKMMNLRDFPWEPLSRQPSQIVNRLGSVACHQRRALLDLGLIWEDLNRLTSFGACGDE